MAKLFPKSSKRGKPFANDIFGNNEKYSPLLEWPSVGGHQLHVLSNFKRALTNSNYHPVPTNHTPWWPRWTCSCRTSSRWQSVTCSLQLQKRALTNSHTPLLGDPGGNLLGTAAWCVLSNFKKGSLKKTSDSYPVPSNPNSWWAMWTCP